MENQGRTKQEIYNLRKNERRYYNSLSSKEKKFYDNLSRKDKDFYLEIGTTEIGEKIMKGLETNIQKLKECREILRRMRNSPPLCYFKSFE